jgi:hypothetical protein
MGPAAATKALEDMASVSPQCRARCRCPMRSPIACKSRAETAAPSGTGPGRRPRPRRSRDWAAWRSRPHESRPGLDLVTLVLTFNDHGLGHMGVDRAALKRAVVASLKPGGPVHSCRPRRTSRARRFRIGNATSDRRRLSVQRGRASRGRARSRGRLPALRRRSARRQYAAASQRRVRPRVHQA